jgi:hypothetical protein
MGEYEALVASFFFAVVTLVTWLLTISSATLGALFVGLLTVGVLAQAVKVGSHARRD